MDSLEYNQLNEVKLAMIGNIGWIEWAVIGLVAVILFGKRLPEVGRSLGRSFVEFKRGLRDVSDEVEDVKKTVKDEENTNNKA